MKLISSIFTSNVLASAYCVSSIHASRSRPRPQRGGSIGGAGSETQNYDVFQKENLEDINKEEEAEEEEKTDLSKMLAWLFDMFYDNRSEQGRNNDPDEADYIIGFDDDLEEVQELARDIAEALGKRPTQIYTKLIRGFTIKGITAEMAARIASIQGVTSVEKDEQVTMDGELRHLDENSNIQQETPWGIGRVGGGPGNTYDGPGVVFVVDSGLDFSHPDLNVDTTRCFTAFDNDDCQDRVGHGTHVAGTIAAKDNGFGVVGVAPGATVVAVKVVGDDGRGSFSTIIRGIQWIADNGKPGDVANISLSGNGNEALDKAIRMAARLGIQFTLSAGNHGGSAKERSPARANGRDIYTICASTETDDLAWFSNTGTPPIDFCAPGVGIKSTYKDGMYATMDGTSMAAPHAAGVLLLGKPKRRNKEVVDDEGNMYKIVALR